MRFKAHKNTIIFVLSNLFGKVLAALAQLYAVFIFTRMQSRDDAALILILLGYAIWFQMFEIGLSQTLQNKFNSKQIYAGDSLRVILAHYLFLLVVGIFVAFTPFIGNLLLPSGTTLSNPSGAKAFAIGVSIMVIASSNVVIQRMLLIINKGVIGNLILVFQALTTMAGLTLYWVFGKSNIIMAVVIYLAPQVLISIPFIINLISKLAKKNYGNSSLKLIKILYDSLGFCGVGILSAIFLGSDYYFVAHYLNSADVIAYYVVTRTFFISFVIYYAHLQFRVKRVSISTLKYHSSVLLSAVKDSILIGVCAVSVIYFLAVILEALGIFAYMTNGAGIGQLLLFSAYLYFVIRVARDVGVVVIGGLNAKGILFRVHLIEGFFGVGFMWILAPMYGAIGILFSQTCACIFGAIFLLWSLKNKKHF